MQIIGVENRDLQKGLGSPLGDLGKQNVQTEHESHKGDPHTQRELGNLILNACLALKSGANRSGTARHRVALPSEVHQCDKEKRNKARSDQRYIEQKLHRLQIYPEPRWLAQYIVDSQDEKLNHE